MFKKYALISLTAVSGAVTGLHFISEGWRNVEQFAYETYQKSKLARYVNLLDESEKSIDMMIKEAAQKYELPEALLKGLIHIESGGKSEALSNKGAIGLTQIMPFNAKRCATKINKLWDEEININCGARILSEELKNYRDVRKSLMAYNGGAVCINKCQESIKYASNVMMKTAEYLIKK